MIKKKIGYGDAQDQFDFCENISNIMEGIVVKYA